VLDVGQVQLKRRLLLFLLDFVVALEQLVLLQFLLLLRGLLLAHFGGLHDHLLYLFVAQLNLFLHDCSDLLGLFLLGHLLLGEGRVLLEHDLNVLFLLLEDLLPAVLGEVLGSLPLDLLLVLADFLLEPADPGLLAFAFAFLLLLGFPLLNY
jgi:hypothetical protein